MINTMNIAWIAGILEGEGYFGLTNNKRNPIIQLSMTDKDVVERVRLFVGERLSMIIAEDKRKDTYKTIYRLNICGSLAISWMMTIYSFMSERRKAKIRSILDIWKQVELNSSQIRNMDVRSLLVRNMMRLGLTKEQALIEIERVANLKGV